MVEALVAVAEQLIELIRVRQASKRDLFVDHVDPIYQDLRLVIDDYREVFYHVLRLLEDPDWRIEDVIEDLEARRKNHARLREEVRAYDNVLMSSPGMKLARPYCAAVAAFFLGDWTQDTDPAFGPTPVPSVTQGLLCQLRYYALAESQGMGVPRSLYLETAWEFLDRVNRCWRSVTEEYYKLRVECLG